ncbi:cytochrome c biogenesis CcdA family protein [Undibacterium sp. Di24W]|uniref:cytochrome c biogenesis CcdA family protein n=1 Tax=Undibacterium sp. Di24W TaxID=3413033 RepID=UPI003BF10654
MISLLFAMLAGALSTLSPCVLPIVPIVMSSALQTTRWAPLALLSGVVLSYTVIGSALAIFGNSIEHTQYVRIGSAVLMIIFGAMFLLPGLQQAFVKLITPLSDVANNKLADFKADSTLTQGLLGMMLGIVWTPCVGPTLGVAITMAANGKHIGHAVMIMFMFGLGAALPMSVLAYGSRAAIGNKRKSMAIMGHRGKQVMGMGLIFVGALVITGFDKSLETLMTSHMPNWLVDLSTRF